MKNLDETLSILKGRLDVCENCIDREIDDLSEYKKNKEYYQIRNSLVCASNRVFHNIALQINLEFIIRELEKIKQNDNLSDKDKDSECKKSVFEAMEIIKESMLYQNIYMPTSTNIIHNECCHNNFSAAREYLILLENIYNSKSY